MTHQNGTLETVYSAKLKHGLWGYYPLVVCETDEPLLCLDREIIKRALLSVECRDFEVHEDRLFADRGTRLYRSQDRLASGSL
jgi:hypothetical protein